jgi:hypothetical protein
MNEPEPGTSAASQVLIGECFEARVLSRFTIHGERRAPLWLPAASGVYGEAEGGSA